MLSLHLFFFKILTPHPNPPMSLKFRAIFKQFSNVWSEWNSLHKFILGRHLWGLHFFSSKLPRSPEFPPYPLTIFPLFLNTFPLYDLDETSYVDSFWDGICFACISFPEFSPSLKFPHYPINLSSYFWTLSHCPIWMKITTWIHFGMAFVRFAFFLIPFLPLKIFTLYLKAYPLSDLDETSYIDSFWDDIDDDWIFFLIPTTRKTIPLNFFQNIPNVQFGWNLLHR